MSAARVPDGWSIERRADGRIGVVKLGYGGAYVQDDPHFVTAETTLYFLAEDLLAAPAAPQAAADAVDVAKLKALAQAATPGPWEQRNKRVPYVWAVGQVKARDEYLLHKMPIGDDAKDYHPNTRATWLADAAFIAAANPAVILALIAAVESAQPQPAAAPSVAQLVAQLQDYDEKWTPEEQRQFAVFLQRFPNESSAGIISLGSAWKHGKASVQPAAAPLSDPVRDQLVAALQTAEMAMLGYTTRNAVVSKALKDARAAILAASAP